MFKKTISAICVIAALILLVIGNISQETPQPDCPFTTAAWDYTEADVIALENSEYRTYDSIYLGLTYNFAKEYAGRPGTVKYMFDDQGSLKCVAWVYTGDINDVEGLMQLYNEIHAQLVEKYGESGYQNSNATSGGDVWYFETGNVLISTMMTSDATALQFSYLHPDVSHAPKGSNKTAE